MKKVLVFLFLFWSAAAYSQADSLLYSVRGVVRDYETGKPLQAVAVAAPGTSIAVITNRDGTFVIKCPSPVETLNFSLLGYRNMRQATPDAPGKVMSVRLVRGAFTLDAATVMTGDPLAILALAIERRPYNAPDKPELLDCFYRETVQKYQRYIYVSEAVTKVYKSEGTGFSVRDRASVVKSRLLTSPRQSDTLGVKVQGGPAMTVDLDLVKNGGVIIDNEELQNYHLEMKAPEMIDNRMQFVIGLSPATSPGYALYNGTVYIDRETLAFTRLELSLDMSKPNLATRVMLVKLPPGIRFKPKEMSLVLNYNNEGGKTRLSYLRTCFRFNCDWRKRLFATDYTAVAEMVVTNRYTGAEVARIPRSDTFRSADILADKTQYYTDPDFWAAYNIIEPSTSLEHALGKLKHE